MIRMGAAAALLGVSPNTLRGWEQRYGYPQPVRSPGGQRHYVLEQVEALRQTLAETGDAAVAVALAEQRRTSATPTARLAGALSAFDEQSADRILEESLALRSVERTIEEVLLPAVAGHAGRGDGNGAAAAAYGFAWRHAAGWLSAQKRLTPPASRPEAVVILDAWDTCDLDTLHAQALEVILRRAGLRTLALAVEVDRGRLLLAVRALEPRALVLSGPCAPLEEIARLVYTVRKAVPTVQVFDYRGAVPETGASTIPRLGGAPLAACEQLLAHLAGSVPAAAGRAVAAAIC